jgi:regulator of sigma E protease
LFGALIFVHEMGHYVAARIFDVHIHEFSIGMGPKILGKKSKKTGIDYSLRALPIGGYVMMAGEDEEVDDPRALNKKPVWQRIIITAAGGLVNIIVGFILTFVMVMTMANLGSTTIASFDEGAVSSAYLKVNDRIVAVDGVSVRTHMDVVYEISRLGIEPLDITVIRDGEKITLSDVVFPQSETEGIAFGDVDFKFYRAKKDFGEFMKQSYSYCVLYVRQVWEGLYDLVTGRYGVSGVSGPIGVTEQIGSAAKQGATTLLSMVILISVNLGVVNLLPFPALDGGRLFFMFIELIFRKKVPTEIEAKIHFVGIVVLMGLMLAVSGKDIVSLFKK